MSQESSDDEQQATQERVERWSEEFTKSPHFERLTESQKEKADAVITFFAEYAYSYLGATPEEWDRSVVIECCTEVLPRKVSAEPAFFEAVAPVLSAFFTFLADQACWTEAAIWPKRLPGWSGRLLLARRTLATGAWRNH